MNASDTEQQASCTLDALRDKRNAAQAELERYLLEQFPIDTEQKNLGVTMRTHAVTEIEEEMRHEMLRAQAHG
ncbi:MULTISPECIES: hypothetical protein [unclassified Pseudomonas]|uniref:hypothetical protein n=1 Tax=unclassified Pseudomonas TaxID=196821 RepID=UPI0024493511|nr:MULTISPECIES: hypothetical protein [unclassified Pseudomonas]MDG9924446.1 hypothetical protein [Pseudomonas sp. GD04045]MDH0035214.1 hypothetical protein [Pseudomonas sp. GD04019]